MADLEQKAKEIIREIARVDVMSTRYVEAICIVVLSILVIMWMKPKTDPDLLTVRHEQHNGKPVQVVSDPHACNKILAQLLASCSSSFIIGFDCEWTRSSHQTQPNEHKIALIQIATPNEIILLRVNKMDYVIPQTLQTLLSNKQIIKCGVKMHEIVTRLNRDFNVQTLGVLELNDLYKASSFNDASCNKSKSLRDLYSIVTGKQMEYKDKSITMSHWTDTSVLSKGQIWYAADDALVCYELFVALAEDIFGIIDESEYVAECKPFVDTAKTKGDTTKTDK